MSLNNELTHHFSLSKLGKRSGALPDAVQSYLTRCGRGFYPGCFRFLSDVSVLLADDIISNEKHVQFGRIFLRKSPTKCELW